MFRNLVTALVLLVGCDSVLLDKVIGEKDLRKSELRQYEGWWRMEKSSDPMRLNLSQDGLELGLLEHDKDKGFTVVKSSIELRRIGSQRFLFAKNGEMDSHLFFLVDTLEKNRIVLSEPDFEFLKNCLSDGSVDGLKETETRFSKTLTLLANEKLTKLLESEEKLEKLFPKANRREFSRLN